MKRTISSLLLTLMLAGLASTARADSVASTAADPDTHTSITSHRGSFNGRSVTYQAIAGDTILHDKDGAPRAAIFSVAYVATGRLADARRPITFLFNGGPGSASFWIQMGALGPRIVEAGRVDGRSDLGPGRAISDNPEALLDVTDLVFIDPVGTGFSRALGSAKDGDFYTTNADAESVADFIAQWLTNHDGWNRPRFVGGESYGAIRTALILGHDDWLTFNGAILISQGLDWGTVIMPPGYDLGYQQFLPSYTAAAWYHGLIDRTGSVATQVAAAADFAYGDYAVALAQGAFLSPADRDRVAIRLAALTGIPAADWSSANLRIPPDRFRRIALASKGMRIARFDARFTTPVDNVFDPDESLDPSLTATATPYEEAMRAYLGTELAVRRPQTYRPLTNAGWTYDLDNEAFLNPAPHIGNAMRANPGLKLFVASGFYDFSSPVASTRYNIGHAGIPLDRTTLHYYPAGHMMYVDPAERRQLLNDLRRFIATSLPNAEAVR